MLSDHEAEEIERGRRQKMGGPIILKWVDQLLADRRERIRQLEHVRQRLNQAFRYLEGLVREAQRGQAIRPGPEQKALCPSCGKTYGRAAATSPQAIVYFHADGRECRSLTPPAP